MFRDRPVAAKELVVGPAPVKVPSNDCVALMAGGVEHGLSQPSGACSISGAIGRSNRKAGPLSDNTAVVVGSWRGATSERRVAGPNDHSTALGGTSVPGGRWGLTPLSRPAPVSQEGVGPRRRAGVTRFGEHHHSRRWQSFGPVHYSLEPGPREAGSVNRSQGE